MKFAAMLKFPVVNITIELLFRSAHQILKKTTTHNALRKNTYENKIGMLPPIERVRKGRAFIGKVSINAKIMSTTKTKVKRK